MDFETEIDDLQETIATLKSEIDALGDGIRALDKQVAEATEQRKEENADYKEELASKSAAKGILAFAMNRLHEAKENVNIKKTAMSATATGHAHAAAKLVS